ncbi:MAG: PAS domain S-box protein [Candidatus Omnitrophica bacterium]|nr:PAS domain S-box protein [Candidatus Omnitrophota bacterium]
MLNPGTGKKNKKSPVGDKSLLKKIRKEYLTEEKILKDSDLNNANLYLDFVNEMIIVLDRNQRVLKINKKGCEILGYPENEIIGKKYFDTFIPARFRQEMKEFFNDLVSGKKILRRYFENPVLTKKGERLIAWRNAILKDSKGNIIGTISEGRDITEESKRQQQLIDSEKRFRLLFENAPAGFIACFLNGKIFDINQYFTTLTGFEEKDLVGKNFRTIIFPADRKIFAGMFDRIRKSFDLNIAEFRLLRKDGSVIDVYCTARVAGTQDKIIQIIIYDITHRRVVENLQRIQEKLSAVLNESYNSSEILSRVSKLIRKGFGFEKVAVYFKDDLNKQDVKRLPLPHICKYLKNKKISAGKFNEYGSFISSFRISGKEKFYACIPFEAERGLIAVLYCEDTIQSKFNPETIKFLENMAGIICVGLQRCESFETQRAALENFYKFINSTRDMAFIKDSKFRYIYVNDEYAKFFKKQPKEILGKTDFALMKSGPAKGCRETDKQALKRNRLVINEETVDGRVYETRKFPVKLETGETGVGAFIRDITEEKKTKKEIENIMWMYSMLYQVNQAIVRAKTTEQLFKDICEIACNEGKFVLAWIGMVDYEKKIVFPVAGSKKNKDYYKDLVISLNPQVPEGKGPTARAVRTGRLCVCNDFLSDGRMKAWWDKAKEYGFCSSACVPIKVSRKIIGALNLYSDQKEFFSDEIKKLLIEVSSDIGLCIEKLNAEKIRKNAEKSLRENEEHLRGLFENIPVPVVEMDFSEIKSIMDSIRNQRDIKTYLENNVDRLKSSIRVLNINRQLFELFDTNDTGELVELLKNNLITLETMELLYTGKKVEQFQTKMKTKSGIEKDVLLNFRSIKERDWSRVVVSIFDITDRVHMEKNIDSVLARFRGFFDTASAGMGILDLEGRPVILNNRICEMLGYSREELMKMKLADVIHPDEVPFTKLTYEKLKKGEIDHYEGERRYVRKDGSIVWAYVSAQRVFDTVLNDYCITAVAVDMTQQKQYMMQLERIQNVLQSYAECGEIFTKADNEKQMLFSVCNELTKKAKLGFTIIVLRNISAIEIAAYPDEGFEFLFELKELYLEKHQICPTIEGLFENKRNIVGDVEQSNYPEDWKKIVLKYGYNSVFALPIVVEGNSIGCMTIFSPEKNRFVDEKENSIIAGIAEDVGHCLTALRARKEMEVSTAQLEKSYEQLQKTIEGISLSIAKIIETRDPYTAGHQVRVANLAVAIAKEMGIPENKIRGLYFAGILHDIGKVNVPVEILVKPTRLTEDEFNIIKLHSIYGYEILNKIPFPWEVAKIVLQHHERLNGSGYPEGITEKEILQEAKIIAVADVVEAMAFDRPYRTGFGIDFALAEIENKKGVLFDPEIVDVCIRLFKENRFSFE